MTRETHQTRDLFFFFFLPVFIFFRQGRVSATTSNPSTYLREQRDAITLHLPFSSVDDDDDDDDGQTVHVAPSIRRSRGRFETRPGNRSGVRVAAITGPCLPARDRSLSLSLSVCPRRTAGEISTQFLMAQAQPVRPLKSPFQTTTTTTKQMNEILPIEGLLHNKPSPSPME